MVKQSFRVVNQFFEVTIFFDTEQLNLGDAFLIEAERIRDAIANGKSFMEYSHRVIIAGNSVGANSGGSPID